MQKNKYKERVIFNVYNNSEKIDFDDVIDAIKKKELAGIIIKNFFSINELDEIKDYKNKVRNPFKLNHNLGVTYPTVFAHIYDSKDKEKINNYFEECANFNHDFSQLFNVDFLKKLYKSTVQNSIFFTSLNSIPNEVLKKSEFPFTSIRELYTESGEIYIHCGKLFYNNNVELYTRIHEVVGKELQLSYFSLVQKPKEGGKLLLYDILWDEFQEKIGEKEIILKSNLKIDAYDLNQSVEIDLSEGDLIIFNGGDFWHRVSKIHGNTNRMSIGGFLGLNKDKIYVWS